MTTTPAELLPNLHLYGVAEAPLRLSARLEGVPGPDGRPAAVSVVEAEGCALIVSPGGGPIPADTRDARFVARLLGHQRVLEQVMRKHCVIPFKFGAWVPDPYLARQLAAQAEPLLREVFRDFGGLCETSLTVSWDVGAQLRGLAGDPVLAGLRARAEQTGAEADRAAVGAHLQGRLESLRQERAAALLRALEPLAKEVVTDEALVDSVVLNAHFLVRRAGELALIEGVEAQDDAFAGALHFRLLETQPPFHFRCLRAEVFPADELRRAATVLGLTGGAPRREALRAAFRERLFALHPDGGGRGGDPARLLEVQRAYQTLWAALGSRAALDLDEPAAALTLLHGAQSAAYAAAR